MTSSSFNSCDGKIDLSKLKSPDKHLVKINSCSKIFLFYNHTPNYSNILKIKFRLNIPTLVLLIWQIGVQLLHRTIGNLFKINFISKANYTTLQQDASVIYENIILLI